MSIVRQIKEGCNPARDIVEGKRKPVAVVTVPVRVLVLTPLPAPAPLAVTDFLARPAAAAATVGRVKVKRRNSCSFNAFLDAYLAAHKNEFTIADLEAFASQQGWAGNVKSSVYNHHSNGHLLSIGKRQSATSRHLLTVYQLAGFNGGAQ